MSEKRNVERTPPQSALWLLRRFLPVVEYEVISGDLEEEFADGRSRGWFYRQVLRSLWACRDRWTLRRGRSPIGVLLGDLRYSGRSLRRSPSLLVLGVLALGLAIGANTAVFSVVNGVLWRPLPYPEPERLGLLRISVGGLERVASLSAPELVDFREAKLLDDVAARWIGWNVIRREGRSDRIRVSWITRNFFPMLGLNPLLGRHFTEEEEDPEGPSKVIILSHSLWQTRFGGDPDIVGKRVAMEGSDRTIVGVMPAGMRVMLNPESTNRPGPDAWIPNTFWVDRDTHWLRAIVRLKEGATWEQAQSEVDAMTAEMKATYTEYEKYGELRFHVDPLHEELVGSARPALLTLSAMVALVLLIACANVAAMLMARAQTRRTEVAVRGALGASRQRIAFLVLSESALLATGGAALGVALAWGFQRLLIWLGPEGIPRLADIQLDPYVLLFCGVVSLLTVAFFGGVPVLQLVGLDLVQQLRGGARWGLQGSRGRFQRFLVAGEIALAFVLLVGAGLMARSLVRLYDEDLGFRSDNVLTLRLNLPFDRYRDEPARAAFLDRAIEVLESDADVLAAGATNLIPLEGGFLTGHVAPEGREELFGNQEVDYSYVTPGYLEALDIRLLSGRVFSSDDLDQNREVVLLDERLARQFWPDQSPIGRRVKAGIGDNYWAEVVGVVASIRNDGVRAEGLPQLYLPHHGREPSAYLAVWTKPGRGSAAGIRSRLQQLDSDVPVSEIEPLSHYVREDLADVSFALSLMAGLAGLALVLTVVGIYGVISYWVSQASNSFGLRMALGAIPREIGGLVVRQGLFPLLVGLAIGAGGAIALGRSMQSLLYGVTATDTTTFVGIALLLVLVTLAACLIPARRATLVDPAVTLRGD